MPNKKWNHKQGAHKQNLDPSEGKLYTNRAKSNSNLANIDHKNKVFGSKPFTTKQESATPPIILMLPGGRE